MRLDASNQSPVLSALEPAADTDGEFGEQLGRGHADVGGTPLPGDVPQPARPGAGAASLRARPPADARSVLGVKAIQQCQLLLRRRAQQHAQADIAGADAPGYPG